MENSIDSGIISSLDVITQTAESIIDEVAELKAYISDKQKENGLQSNKCSIRKFWEDIAELNKKRKKQGKPPIKPLILD